MIYQSVLRPDELNCAPYTLIVSTLLTIIGLAIAFIWASQAIS
jgi:hypothetical protein